MIPYIISKKIKNLLLVANVIAMLSIATACYEQEIVPIRVHAQRVYLPERSQENVVILVNKLDKITVRMQGESLSSAYWIAQDSGGLQLASGANADVTFESSRDDDLIITVINDSIASGYINLSITIEGCGQEHAEKLAGCR